MVKPQLVLEHLEASPDLGELDGRQIDARWWLLALTTKAEDAGTGHAKPGHLDVAAMLGKTRLARPIAGAGWRKPRWQLAYKTLARWSICCRGRVLR